MVFVSASSRGHALAVAVLASLLCGLSATSQAPCVAEDEACDAPFAGPGSGGDEGSFAQLRVAKVRSQTARSLDCEASAATEEAASLICAWKSDYDCVYFENKISWYCLHGSAITCPFLDTCQQGKGPPPCGPSTTQTTVTTTTVTTLTTTCIATCGTCPPGQQGSCPGTCCGGATCVRHDTHGIERITYYQCE